MAEPVRRAGPGRGRTGALRTANAVEFGSEKTGTGLLKSLLLTGSCLSEQWIPGQCIPESEDNDC